MVAQKTTRLDAISDLDEPIAQMLAALSVPLIDFPDSVLHTAVTAANQELSAFAADPTFVEDMVTAFGQTINRQQLESLRQQWQDNNFTSMPTIEIRSGDEMHGGKGAYSKDTNTIYLSDNFLIQNQDNPLVIKDVLLEEIGHSIDARINMIDAAGDEGAIFGATVEHTPLSIAELQNLRAEVIQPS